METANGLPDTEPGSSPVAANDKPTSENVGENNRKRSAKPKEKGRAQLHRERANKGGERSGEWREVKRRKLDRNGVEVVPKNPFTEQEIAAEERRPKKKVAVMIGYSGTGYRGMQVNRDEPTIERDLFRAFIAAGAISKANADDPRKSSLSRCARTDKGVHAAGNIISLKLIIEDPDIVTKINNQLPPQIRVWGIERTNNSFSCYQGCDSRWYEYLLPSYCLLPPHPDSFLGTKLREMAAEYGGEEELAAQMADVQWFWEEVEEKEVKPMLSALEPEVRVEVLRRAMAHASEEEAEAAPSGQPLDPTNPDIRQDKPAEVPSISTLDHISHDELQTVGADHGKVHLDSVQPKSRNLNPIDYALRDLKAIYVGAKRRYRVSPTRLQRLQSALDKYPGTNNFHNFTVQKSHSDPSARRHIKSFVVNPEPIRIRDTEWLSLKVHGQSFMMHQIRKMVGLAALLVRCGTPLERVDESYGPAKMAIPKAPGLGLLLERPVFDLYNKRAVDTLGRETIDFGKYEVELEAFKKREIYQRIFDTEEEESSFHSFFNQVDSFKTNHFLWLTAGGMKVAEIPGRPGGKGQEDVDKQLGDEDEDPEGGEG